MLSFSSLLGRAGSLGCHLGVNWWSGKGLSLEVPRRLSGRKRTRRSFEQRPRRRVQETGRGRQREKVRERKRSSRGIPDWQPTTNVSFTIIQGLRWGPFVVANSSDTSEDCKKLWSYLTCRVNHYLFNQDN